jgi:hypothetical protein
VVSTVQNLGTISVAGTIAVERKCARSDDDNVSVTLYQWQMQLSHDAVATTRLSFLEYICLPAPLKPLSILGDCADRMCQVCYSGNPA